MKLKTVIIPEFSQRYTLGSQMTNEQWRGYISDMEDEGNKVIGNWWNYTIHFAACEHTYAPTLAAVHNWLHDEGPLYLSWREGRLCPFNPEVGRKNMTCCEGNMEKMRCSGIPSHRIHGRVVCYEWNHVLNAAYWELDNQWLVDNLPDDERLVAFHIMRKVLRQTGWFEWRQEKMRRMHKRKAEWLAAIERRR